MSSAQFQVASTSFRAGEAVRPVTFLPPNTDEGWRVLLTELHTVRDRYGNTLRHEIVVVWMRDGGLELENVRSLELVVEPAPLPPGKALQPLPFRKVSEEGERKVCTCAVAAPTDPQRSSPCGRCSGWVRV